MKAKDIGTVCAPCGIAANYLTCMAKYGHPPLKPAFDVYTVHQGTCDCCGRETAVSSARDFFWPNFKLLNSPAWRKAMREGQDGSK